MKRRTSPQLSRHGCKKSTSRQRAAMLRNLTEKTITDTAVSDTFKNQALNQCVKRNSAEVPKLHQALPVRKAYAAHSSRGHYG